MNSRAPTFQIGPITPAAPGPLYQQIVDAVRREICAGRMEPDTPLPSFRALAAELLVSLITVKRAYEELEREGIIYRRQGLGTFVANRGDEKGREAKRLQAVDLLSRAAREATEAGISKQEFIKLARRAAEEGAP